VDSNRTPKTLPEHLHTALAAVATVQIGTDRERKVWTLSPEGPETENDCAGEDQQQFARSTDGHAIAQTLVSHRGDSGSIPRNVM
jgi:hypothetical protein